MSYTAADPILDSQIVLAATVMKLASELEAAVNRGDLQSAQTLSQIIKDIK